MTDHKQRKPGSRGETTDKAQPGTEKRDNRDSLYDLGEQSRNPRKKPEAAEESLQAEPVADLAGNGTQDRRPGKGRRGANEEQQESGNRENDAATAESEDDMPTGRERDHDFSGDDGAELKRMEGDGKLDKT